MIDNPVPDIWEIAATAAVHLGLPLAGGLSLLVVVGVVGYIQLGLKTAKLSRETAGRISVMYVSFAAQYRGRLVILAAAWLSVIVTVYICARNSRWFLFREPRERRPDEGAADWFVFVLTPVGPDTVEAAIGSVALVVTTLLAIATIFHLPILFHVAFWLCGGPMILVGSLAALVALVSLLGVIFGLLSPTGLFGVGPAGEATGIVGGWMVPLILSASVVAAAASLWWLTSHSDTIYSAIGEIRSAKS
ncbi:hypothetical protein ACLBXX_00470 [Microbacterium sp. C23T]